MKGLPLWTWIAVIVLVVGGLNWGFVGLFSFNLVQAIFGEMLSRIIYIVVGVAAGYVAYLLIMKKE